MPRRPGVRLPSAPPASLALVLCVLIAFVGLLSPASADQSGPAQEASRQIPGEAGAEGESEGQAQTRKAERLLRRAERKAEKASEAAAEAPAPASGVGAGTKVSRQAARAERAARRAARKNAAEGATRSAAAAPASSSKGKASEREREERRRAHEEQRRKSGRESYREKQARIAREASEAEATLGSQGSTGKGAPAPAVVAAGGLAPSAGPETAKLASPGGAGAQSVQGTKTTRAPARRHPRRAARAGAALSSGTLPAAGALATGEGATAGSAAPSRTAHRSSSPRRRSTPAKSSPIVTTVTRIIGVVPTLIWLLVGALALAAAVFASSSRLAARRARRLDRQRRALLEDVGLLQAALLPELPERLGPVSTTAGYRPASGPGAGGDFYDVFALPEGLVAVLVGDVSGHGRDALPHTTLLRYTLRAYLEAGLGPREALRAAAPALERQLGGSFATVVLATYDPRERLLTYACAGHPHPLLSGLDPDAAIIAASAPPIGAGSPTGTRETVVSIPGAAVVAFYTDGVIEARVGGELFGQRRLAAELERLGGEASAVSLLDGVAAQTDRRPDDMAACLLHVSGGEAPPRIVREQIELDGREAGRARAGRFLAAAGVPEAEAARALSRARSIAADHGSALLSIEKDERSPRLTLTHDNVAPLRARALARTQEVAL